MKSLREIFFGKKDWDTVWEGWGDWLCTGVKKQWEEKCIYKIQYSPSRNRYRLKTSGLDPKAHSAYKVALDKLDHFENQL